MQASEISGPFAEMMSSPPASTWKKWPKGDLRQMSLNGVTFSRLVILRASRIVHFVSLAIEFDPSSYL